MAPALQTRSFSVYWFSTRDSTSPRSPSREQEANPAIPLPCPVAPHGACHLFSPPRPGHLSDSSRGPPTKDPAHASTPPGNKAVQTQQPCSVRASLSTDICSGLASDGGGARGQGDFQLACLQACASHVGPQWCPRSTPVCVEGSRATAKAAKQLYKNKQRRKL